MKFDTGTIIAIAAVLLFYLRLILLQRQRGKNISAVSPSGKGKSKRQAPTPSAPGNWIVIANAYLVGMGVLLIMAGVAVTLITAVPGSVRQLWWLFVSLGVLLMGLGIR